MTQASDFISFEDADAAVRKSLGRPLTRDEYDGPPLDFDGPSDFPCCPHRCCYGNWDHGTPEENWLHYRCTVAGCRGGEV